MPNLCELWGTACLLSPRVGFAITARKQGAEVTILEKGPLIGGTTLRSGGGYWIPNNRFQREKGIDDRKEDALRYMVKAKWAMAEN